MKVKCPCCNEIIEATPFNENNPRCSIPYCQEEAIYEGYIRGGIGMFLGLVCEKHKMKLHGFQIAEKENKKPNIKEVEDFNVQY
jgi:hypothetical protein